MINEIDSVTEKFIDSLLEFKNFIEHHRSQYKKNHETMAFLYKFIEKIRILETRPLKDSLFAVLLFGPRYINIFDNIQLNLRNTNNTPLIFLGGLLLTCLDRSPDDYWTRIFIDLSPSKYKYWSDKIDLLMQKDKRSYDGRAEERAVKKVTAEITKRIAIVEELRCQLSEFAVLAKDQLGYRLSSG